MLPFARYPIIVETYLSVAMVRVFILLSLHSYVAKNPQRNHRKRISGGGQPELVYPFHPVSAQQEGTLGNSELPS